MTLQQAHLPIDFNAGVKRSLYREHSKLSIGGAAALQVGGGTSDDCT